jgi:Protein of unknown function (DUF2905)
VARLAESPIVHARASKRSFFYTLFVESYRELGRALIALGIFLLFIGALLYSGGRLPLKLGRLPGDIIHRGQHATFYFPIVTCLVLSLVLSLFFWLAGHFRK